MKSLHRNKNGVSAAGLTERDYSVLNYEELLAVNGAGGRVALAEVVLRKDQVNLLIQIVET